MIGIFAIAILFTSSIWFISFAILFPKQFESYSKEMMEMIH